MYNLFLDDVRTPESTYKYTLKDVYILKEWSIVRSYEAFVAHITTHGLPKLISFDHDLAKAHYHESMYKGREVYMKYIETTTEKTGYDCAKWLVEYCINNNLNLPNFMIHSMNPVGGENIQMLLENFKKHQSGEK